MSDARPTNFSKVCVIADADGVRFFSNSLTRSNQPVIKSKTSKVVKEPRILRSGVIPYTIIENQKWFALFIDATYHELTDGGGGTKASNDFLVDGIRELKEESLGIFDFTPLSLTEMIRNMGTTIVGFYRTRRIALTFFEVFLPTLRDLEISMLRYRRLYETNLLKQRNGEWVDSKRMENNFLVWIPEQDFKGVCLSEVRVGTNTTVPLNPFAEEFIRDHTESKAPSDEPPPGFADMIPLPIAACERRRPPQSNRETPTLDLSRPLLTRVALFGESRKKKPKRHKKVKRYIPPEITNTYPRLYEVVSTILRVIYRCCPTIV